MIARIALVLACAGLALAQDPDSKDQPQSAVERLTKLQALREPLPATAEKLERELASVQATLAKLEETYEDSDARRPSQAEVRVMLQQLEARTDRDGHESRLRRFDRALETFALVRDGAAAELLEQTDGDAGREELERLRDEAQEVYLEVRAQRAQRERIHDALRETLFLLRRENLFLRGKSAISVSALRDGVSDLRELPGWLAASARATGSYVVDSDRRGGLLRLAGALVVLFVLLVGVGRWLSRREKKERRTALGRLLGALTREYRPLAFALLCGGAPLLASVLLTGLPPGVALWLRKVAFVLAGFFAARWLMKLMLPGLRADVARRLRFGLRLLLYLTVTLLPLLYALKYFGYQNHGALELLWLCYQVLVGAVVLFVLLKKSFLLGLLPARESGLGRLLHFLVRFLQPVAVLLVPTLLVLSALRFDILAGLITRFAVGAVVAAIAGALLYQLACTLSRAWLRSRQAVHAAETGSDGPKGAPRATSAEAQERHAATEGAWMFALSVGFLLFSLWLFLTLSGSDLDELRGFLETPLPLLGGGGTTWWDLIVGASLLTFFLAATKHVKSTLQHQFLRGTKLDPGLQYTVTMIVGYIIVGTGLYLAVRRVFDLSHLGTIVAALSVGIGFGLQEIISNFVSGLILLFERPLKVGDLVEVGDKEGIVKQINIRATTVLTRDNVFLLVPNREFIGQTVVNYGHSDPRMRLKVGVGVSYSSDTKKVRELLLEIARENDQVLKRPAPSVRFTGFGASSLDFEVLIWINNPPAKDDIASDVCFQIFDKFEEHKIEIPFPQRDLHLKSAIPMPPAESETNKT